MIAARRTVLHLAPASLFLWQSGLALADTAFTPAKIRLDLAPDQSKYNAADEKLRDAAGKLQLALNAEDVKVGSPNQLSMFCTSFFTSHRTPHAEIPCKSCKLGNRTIQMKIVLSRMRSGCGQN